MMRLRFGLGRAGQAWFGRRWPGGILACAIALAVGATMAGAGAPDVPEVSVPGTESASDKPGSASADAGGYVREGTELVNQLGYFRATGDRVTFFSDGGKARFIVLENLNLDRITRSIADDPMGSKWIVTGTVTEFRGTNYMFVRRAVLRNRDESGAEGNRLIGGVQSH